jgi:hypothetical protein
MLLLCQYRLYAVCSLWFELGSTWTNTDISCKTSVIKLTGSAGTTKTVYGYAVISPGFSSLSTLIISSWRIVYKLCLQRVCLVTSWGCRTMNHVSNDAANWCSVCSVATPAYTNAAQCSGSMVVGSLSDRYYCQQRSSCSIAKVT